MDNNSSIEAHKKNRGKLGMVGRVPVATTEELATYYTPGVAYPCLAIKEDNSKSFDYTMRGRTAAIVTDGTRVLGLGKIGPVAGMPVMEGKALLLKKFAGVDAMPICIDEHDEDRLVGIIKSLEPTLGTINIEDIETPKCLNIVTRLRGEMHIPIFHDDSEGVATVTLAGLINSMKLSSKKLERCKIVINGTGAAGVGIARLLIHAGVENIVMVDTAGALYKGRQGNMNPIKDEIAAKTNIRMEKGDLSDVSRGADILIGASVKGAFTPDMIKSMAERPIVFALANPFPEIDYDEAKMAGAYIVATGRSDRPNQVNNLLAFPGVIRGLLESRPTRVDQKMLVDSAKVIAKFLGRDATTEKIVPNPVDKKAVRGLAAKVAAEVVKVANELGIATASKDPKEVEARTRSDVVAYAKYEKRMLK